MPGGVYTCLPRAPMSATSVRKSGAMLEKRANAVAAAGRPDDPAGAIDHPETGRHQPGNRL